MAKVTMPQLGESVAEGTIGKWLKQPGDHVDKYEPLVEVITDKVNAEVPSPFEGVLREILAEEGATVPNNADIAVIETPDEAGGSAATEESVSAFPSAERGASSKTASSPKRPPRSRTAMTASRPSPAWVAIAIRPSSTTNISVAGSPWRNRISPRS